MLCIVEVNPERDFGIGVSIVAQVCHVFTDQNPLFQFFEVS